MLDPISAGMHLEDRLKEFEDLYAECLMDNADVNTLTEIWNQIKAIRMQLDVPIYHYVTPKEFRE